MPVPSGYTLDDATPGPPKLPPGYKLDSGPAGDGAPTKTKATPRSLTQRVSEFVDTHLPNMTAEEMSQQQFPNQTSRRAAMALRPVANVVTRAVRGVAHIPEVLANSHPIDAARQAVVDDLHPLDALRRHAEQGQREALEANHPYDPVTRTGYLEPGQQPSITEQDVTDTLGDAGAQLLVAEAGFKAGGMGRELLGSAVDIARGQATPGRLRRIAQTITGTGDKAVQNELEKIAGNAAEDREKVRGKNKAANERTLRARGVVDERNAGKLKKVAQDRLSAMQQNAEAARAHGEKVQTVRQKNAAKLERRRRLTETQGKVTAVSKALDEKIATAKARATGENNAQWEALRKKTAGQEAPIQPIKDVVTRAKATADPDSSRMFGSILREEDPTELPTLHVDGNPVNPKDGRLYDIAYEATYGEPVPLMEEQTGGVPFDRLQRWYSWLGDQMYGGGGRMNGQTYRALGTVRNALNDAMQNITDRVGATDDLAAARESHTNLMETFSDSPNQQHTVASKALQETSPEYVKEQQRAERIKKLGRYDPEIEGLSTHIGNLQQGASALEKQAGGEFEPIPTPPSPKKLPAFEGESYGEPEETTTLVQPRVNLQELRQQMLTRATKKWSDISQYKIRRLAVSSIGGLVTLVGGGSGTEAGLTTSALYGMSEFAPNLVSGILNKPAVAEWLTKPTLSDLETLRQIPHHDLIKITDGMALVAEEAAKAGRPIAIAPEVQKLIGAGGMARVNAAGRVVPKNAGDARKRAAAVQTDPTADDPTQDSDLQLGPGNPPEDEPEP